MALTTTTDKSLSAHLKCAPRVTCAACAIRDASVFVVVSAEMVAGEWLRIRQWQVPLCDECAAHAVNGVQVQALAKALGGRQ